MDKEQAIALATQYKALVAQYLPMKDFFLFGSYSKGGYTEESDIDVAVIVDKKKDDRSEDSLLWRLCRKVSTYIEPVLLTADEDNPLYYDIVRTGTRL